MGQLDELNSADSAHATALLEPLIERALEIAARVAQRRPFQGIDDLRQKIRQELLDLGEDARLGLFRAHPELAPDNPLAMTGASQSEQGRLDLTSVASEYRARLSDLNAQYRGKFGFPFITALVRHRDMDSVMTEFKTRLENDRAEEIENAIGQIVIVSSARVGAAFGRDGAGTSQDVAASG